MKLIDASKCSYIYLIWVQLDQYAYSMSCRDLNTLFRSSSMASKVLYELMKFVGHQYLVISLKPVIDKVSTIFHNCYDFQSILDIQRKEKLRNRSIKTATR
jgi:hypothetical protein